MNITEIQNQPTAGIIETEEKLAAEHERSIVSGQSLIAEAVIANFPDQVMFVPGIGWHHYDGQRWYTSTGLAEKRISRLIQRQAQRIIATSGNANIDEHTRKDMQRAANRVIDRASEIEGVKAFLATSENVLVNVDELNADPMLLNCANGTLDLRTGELRPHDPRDRITKIAGCGYYPDATAPTWERFLTEAFAGHDGLMQAMAECFGGVGITGKNDEHLLPILYGVAGGGKSTFVDAILEVLNDYAMPAAPELLITSKGAHPTEAMDLLGSRLAICSEINQGAHLNVAAMKRLTGDRFIKARYLYKDFVVFRRSHLLVMVTNDLPVLPPSHDDGVFRRVKVIPFTHKPNEPDLDLPNRLTTELPGILRWLVDGHSTYATQGGIRWPESVQAATADYRDRSDLYGDFIESETVRQVTQTIGLTALHSAWKRWLEVNAPDVKPGRVQDFIDDLRKRDGLTVDTAGRKKVLRDRAFVQELASE